MSLMKDIHDRQYKHVFSNPIFVEKLLTSFVKEDFVKHLDFNRMTKKDKSYVTDKMKMFESDIVYEIYYKNKPFYIFLLMEFQSTVDKPVSIIKDSSIIEANVFANWVNNLLLNCGDELNENEFKMIKKPEEVLPILAASLERYGDQLKQEGLEQGKLKEKKEIAIALNLLEAGAELEFISKVSFYRETAKKYS